jgi:3-hydroxyisobutyrate dehydrogenase-like beta-hydroxyacid dehydrogenase
MNKKITVIGAGRMGSAIATALFNKEFVTTVWNRTSAKTEPLAQLGLRVAPSLLEAINASDVIIVSIINYNSTKLLLRQPEIESALRGKILVQLTTGTPDEARETESWARPHGIEYLDGAILSYPNNIGKPETTILYSGSEELFNRVKPVMLALGDNTMLVGNGIGQASALDIALMAGFGVNTMLGFLYGYIVCEAEKLSVAKYMEFVKSLMPVMEAALSDMCGKLQQRDFNADQASIEAWSSGPRELDGWCKEHGVDHSMIAPQLLVFEKAINAGKGQSDFAYLYEVLKAAEKVRQPAPSGLPVSA